MSVPVPPELGARVRAGDPDAFAQLVRLHERRLWSIGYAMTRNPEDARDVLQETLTLAFRSRGSLQDDTRLEAWLCRIATNCARMLLRTRRRKPTVSIEGVEGTFDAGGHRIEDLRPWSVDPGDAVDRRRLADRLAAASEELPEPYREVWVLADVEQLSMAEVAEVLELTIPNVKTRLHRARLALRKRLADEFERGAA